MSKSYCNSNYPAHLGQKLFQQQKEGNFTDLSIETNGRIFEVHRSVLAADSEFWMAMLKGGFNEENKKSVKLANINAAVFQTMVEYMYMGTFTVTSDSVQALLEAADYLQCSYVKERCVEFIVENINIQSCMQIYQFADNFSLAELKEASIEFMICNFDSLPADAFTGLLFTTLYDV